MIVHMGRVYGARSQTGSRREATTGWLRTVGCIVTLALSILAAPLAANAQKPGKIPLVGVLQGGQAPDPSDPGDVLNAFRQGLRALGYVEGQNIAMAHRFAEGQFERLPELAAELVHLKVDVIVTGGPAAVRVAQHATSTIPIVVAVMHEPVAMGFIASFARPGGNITGLAFQDTDLSTKRLELLKEVVPQLSRVAVLWDPSDGGATALRATERAAQALGLQLHILEVRGPDDLARAFEAAEKARAQALIQLASPLFGAHLKTIVDLATKSRLPATCYRRAFVVAGCLMTYGPSFPDMWRRAAFYVDKILKGAKPADLPVEQPMAFELVINLKTAKALGLTISPSVLFQATEVVQ